MIDDDRGPEPWPGRKSERRPGYYEYKSVRFRLARSSKVDDGWHFQPFGREAQHYPTWEEAVAGLEQTCVAIAQHRAERRNK